MTLFPDRPDLDRRSVGDDLERVYTPDKLARFCVGLLPWKPGCSVLEPHGGGGSFLRALDHLQPPACVWSMDIDPTCWAVRQGRAVVGDFLDRAGYAGNQPWNRWHRVIGNPPFDEAEAHVDRGLEVADEVAFILPVGRLETDTRCVWWRTRPIRKVWLFAERVWDGSRQCGFFWFDKNNARPPSFECEVVSWLF